MQEPDTLPVSVIPNGEKVTDLESLKLQRLRNRLTTTETVTYEREDGEPFQVPTKCFRSIEQDTQPYQREIVVGNIWKPIDLGWAAEWDKIGTIIIQHLGEKPSQKVQTPEEKLRDASKMLYVALGDAPRAYLEYFPKDSFKGVVSDPRALRICASLNTIRLMLTIFPA